MAVLGPLQAQVIIVGIVLGFLMSFIFSSGHQATSSARLASRSRGKTAEIHQISNSTPGIRILSETMQYELVVAGLVPHAVPKNLCDHAT
jgi:hypothetical protein